MLSIAESASYVFSARACIPERSEESHCGTSLKRSRQIQKKRRAGRVAHSSAAVALEWGSSFRATSEFPPPAKIIFCRPGNTDDWKLKAK
jgi:hypothetical protein